MLRVGGGCFFSNGADEDEALCGVMEYCFFSNGTGETGMGQTSTPSVLGDASRAAGTLRWRA